MNIANWIAANKVTPDLWRLIKSEFPAKYRKIQRDIRAWGIDKVKLGFVENLRPEAVLIRL